MRVDAAALERREHGVAAQQRNLALARISAEQHGDPAELLRIGDALLRGGVVAQTHQAFSPRILTSGCRRTPCWRSTVSCTCPISCSISAALRVAVVDDEIGVLGGHRGIAEAESLEARGFDQARRVISRRIREHRAAAPFADRLRGLAAIEQRANLACVRAGRALEGEQRAEEPFIGHRRHHVAIAHLVFARQCGSAPCPAGRWCRPRRRGARSRRRTRRHSWRARRRACPEFPRRTPPGRGPT